MNSIWLFAVAIGPLLLLGGLLYAIIRNRNDTKADIARAERGAKELRDELSREDEN